MCSSVKPDEFGFVQAIDALKNGGIVAYPTETFYGLAVDPENDQAIDSLYALKKREKTKPISLLVPDLEYLSKLVSSIPKPYEKLIESFWPGPLTLIFPVLNNVLLKLIGGDKTIAIRISSNPVAEKLCVAMGKAITATSANVSGEPALITATEVANLWGDKIACIIDGGSAPGGKGSTILRYSENKNECHIIRGGAISRDAITAILPFNYTICNT